MCAESGRNSKRAADEKGLPIRGELQGLQMVPAVERALRRSCRIPRLRASVIAGNETDPG